MTYLFINHNLTKIIILQNIRKNKKMKKTTKEKHRSSELLLIKQMFAVVAMNTGDDARHHPERHYEGRMHEPNMQERIEGCISRPYYVDPKTVPSHTEIVKDVYKPRNEKTLTKKLQSLAVEAARLIERAKARNIPSHRVLLTLKKELKSVNGGCGGWDNAKTLYNAFRKAVTKRDMTPVIGLDSKVGEHALVKLKNNPFVK